MYRNNKLARTLSLLIAGGCFGISFDADAKLYCPNRVLFDFEQSPNIENGAYTVGTEAAWWYREIKAEIVGNTLVCKAAGGGQTFDNPYWPSLWMSGPGYVTGYPDSNGNCPSYDFTVWTDAIPGPDWWTTDQVLDGEPTFAGGVGFCLYVLPQSDLRVTKPRGDYSLVTPDGEGFQTYDECQQDCTDSCTGNVGWPPDVVGIQKCIQECMEDDCGA